MILKYFNFQIQKSIVERKSLYDEVDNLLDRYGITKNSIPPEVKITALVGSLKKLFNKKYFDICMLKECLMLFDLKITDERMNIYRTQHCIDWGEMEEDFKNIMIAMILDDFRQVLNKKETKQLFIEIN